MNIELSDKCRCERIDKLEEQLEQLRHSYKMLQRRSFNENIELVKLCNKIDKCKSFKHNFKYGILTAFGACGGCEDRDYKIK